jgi:hypothetical protein
VNHAESRAATDFFNSLLDVSLVVRWSGDILKRCGLGRPGFADGFEGFGSGKGLRSIGEVLSTDEDGQVLA